MVGELAALEEGGPEAGFCASGGVGGRFPATTALGRIVASPGAIEKTIRYDSSM